MAAAGPACSVCLAPCRWVDDAWVCTRRSCGAEWYADHGEKWAPPGDPPSVTFSTTTA